METQRGKTPEIKRSEPLNQQNPTRTANDQLARWEAAAFLAVFRKLLIAYQYTRPFVLLGAIWIAKKAVLDTA